MGKRSCSLTLIFVGLISVATTLKAQDAHRFQIDIPFEFILSGRTLPAGKYVVQRVDPAKPNVLMFKNTKLGAVRLLIMQRVEGDEPNTTSSLVFLRKDGQSYLFQVWSRDEIHGNQVRFSDQDRQVTPEDKNSKLVRLRAKSP